MLKDSKALCARFLRRVDNCKGCLHFKECKPLYVSKLAIAEKLTALANEQLPRLKNYLAVNSTHHYRLTLEVSKDNEILEQGAYVTLRLELRDQGKKRYKSGRIPVTLRDDYDTLEKRIAWLYRKLDERIKNND